MTAASGNRERFSSDGLDVGKTVARGPRLIDEPRQRAGTARFCGWPTLVQFRRRLEKQTNRTYAEAASIVMIGPQPSFTTTLPR
jgi:hypothetical protein